MKNIHIEEFINYYTVEKDIPDSEGNCDGTYGSTIVKDLDDKRVLWFPDDEELDDRFAYTIEDLESILDFMKSINKFD